MVTSYSCRISRKQPQVAVLLQLARCQFLLLPYQRARSDHGRQFKKIPWINIGGLKTARYHVVATRAFANMAQTRCAITACLWNHMILAIIQNIASSTCLITHTFSSLSQKARRSRLRLQLSHYSTHFRTKQKYPVRVGDIRISLRGSARHVNHQR